MKYTFWVFGWFLFFTFSAFIQTTRIERVNEVAKGEFVKRRRKTTNAIHWTYRHSDIVTHTHINHHKNSIGFHYFFVFVFFGNFGKKNQIGDDKNTHLLTFSSSHSYAHSHAVLMYFACCFFSLLLFFLHFTSIHMNSLFFLLSAPFFFRFDFVPFFLLQFWLGKIKRNWAIFPLRFHLDFIVWYSVDDGFLCCSCERNFAVVGLPLTFFAFFFCFWFLFLLFWKRQWKKTRSSLK